MIRPLQASDFDWMADMHLVRLPNDLSSKIGKAFLKAIVYPIYLDEGLSKVIAGKGCVLVSSKLNLNPMGILPFIFFKPAAWFAIIDFLGRKRQSTVETQGLHEIGYIFADRGYGSLLIRSLDPTKVKTLYALTDTAGSFYERNGFVKVGFEQRGKRKLDIYYLADFSKPSNSSTNAATRASAEPFGDGQRPS